MHGLETISRTRRLAALLVALSMASCGGSPEARRQERERLTVQAQDLVAAQTASDLSRFRSEAELRQYVEHLAEAAQLQQRAWQAEAVATTSGSAVMEAPAAAPAPAQVAASGGEESITNNQVAGVDEGGIVKVHGDHLVILRRGRLFTVRIGDADLRPVAMIDAFPPGAAGGWYDEMLVHDDTVVVVGFNYQEGGTELGIFDIDRDGQLRRRGTHYLRSNDYYSSRNYASRLLGDRLVFYMPYSLLAMRYEGNDVHGDYTLPGVRTRGDAQWDDVIRATQIYRPVQTSASPALHTVVTCDLSRPELECTAQGIVGPAGRSFFVAEDAVYVWVGGESPSEARDHAPDAVVYRLPFDGSAVGAVRVAGMPTDQLSFERRNGNLDVLVRAESIGDWMWGPEVTSGDIALVKLPLAMFSDGLTTAPREAYTALPMVSGGWAFQNRFVNGHVLYGLGAGWGDASSGSQGQVIVHGVDDGRTAAVALPHGVDRIEVMGSDAVVVGAGGGSLHFSAVSLGATPAVVGHYAQEGASQGETRTHGFFYRAASETEGALGLPIRGGDGAGWHQLVAGSAGVLFLHVVNHQFTPLGVLASSGAETDDRCLASCVDWYGNARPIFLRGRVIALLGYELVEGRVEGTSIREVSRTNFYRDR